MSACWIEVLDRQTEAVTGSILTADRTEAISRIARLLIAAPDGPSVYRIRNEEKIFRNEADLPFIKGRYDGWE